MFTFYFTKHKGFTLIELLVVISIIGVLASVVMVSLNSARVKSRDTARKAQLEEISRAFDIYYSSNGSYHIPNTGGSNYGYGWFSYEGSGYPRSIARGLVEEGYIPTIPYDPLLSGPNATYENGQYAYSRYCYTATGSSRCDPTPLTVTCMLADLENPTASDIATVDNSGLPSTTITSLKGTYHMSYAVCRKNQ